MTTKIINIKLSLLEKNNYYSFGLKHGKYNAAKLTQLYNHLFNSLL